MSDIPSPTDWWPDWRPTDRILDLLGPFRKRCSEGTVHRRKVFSKKEGMLLFPTDQYLANILGVTDPHYDILQLLFLLLVYPIFLDSQTPAAAPDEISDPNLTLPGLPQRTQGSNTSQGALAATEVHVGNIIGYKAPCDWLSFCLPVGQPI